MDEESDLPKIEDNFSGSDPHLNEQMGSMEILSESYDNEAKNDNISQDEQIYDESQIVPQLKILAKSDSVELVPADLLDVTTPPEADIDKNDAARKMSTVVVPVMESEQTVDAV